MGFVDAFGIMSALNRPDNIILIDSLFEIYDNALRHGILIFGFLDSGRGHSIVAYFPIS